MKKSIIVSFLFIACCAQYGSAQQDSLTVDQSVQRVLATHPILAQSAAAIRMAEARVSQTETARQPEVIGEAGYTRLDPVSEFSIPGLGSLPVFSPNNYDAHVGARYTVYDFGKSAAAVDLSRSRVQTSTDVRELTRSSLAVQTRRIFYTILLLRQSLLVQDDQLHALHEHLVVIQKRVAAGTATTFDILTTQVRIAAADNQRVELRNALEKQETQFRQLLALTTGTAVALRGDFGSRAGVLSVDSLMQIALEQRAEVRLVGDAEHTALLQKNAAGLGNAPSVKASVTYGFKNGFEPNFDVLRGNWAASISVQVPFYDGGRADAQVQEADAAIIGEQAHRIDVVRQIRADIEQVLADVRAANEKVEISEVQLAQAREAVAIAAKRYETGSVTNLDVLDAETAMTVAEHTRLQALYKYVMSTVELDRALGKQEEAALLDDRSIRR
jgi:outer membrane protein